MSSERLSRFLTEVAARDINFESVIDGFETNSQDLLRALFGNFKPPSGSALPIDFFPTIRGGRTDPILIARIGS